MSGRSGRAGARTSATAVALALSLALHIVLLFLLAVLPLANRPTPPVAVPVEIAVSLIDAPPDATPAPVVPAVPAKTPLSSSRRRLLHSPQPHVPSVRESKAPPPPSAPAVEVPSRRSLPTSAVAYAIANLVDSAGPTDTPANPLLPAKPGGSISQEPGGVGGLVGTHRGESGITARIDHDGNLSMKGPRDVSDVKPTVLRIRRLGARPSPFEPDMLMFAANLIIDVNDWIFRLAGEDPYRHAKRKFAAATREQRFAMAANAAAVRRDTGLFQLKDRLASLLRTSNAPPAQKREALFLLWDDCEEARQEGGADGNAARITIMAAIRRTFPVDGPEAFSADELARFNQRRVSRERFDPYPPR